MKLKVKKKIQCSNSILKFFQISPIKGFFFLGAEIFFKMKDFNQTHKISTFHKKIKRINLPSALSSQTVTGLILQGKVQTRYELIVVAFNSDKQVELQVPSHMA